MEKEFLGGYSKGWWDSAKKNRALVRKDNTIDPQKLWEKGLGDNGLVAQINQKAIEKLNAQWAQEITSDPQLGGSNLEQTKHNVGKAMAYADDEFKNFIQNTGIGNLPSLVRFLNKIGSQMNSDMSYVNGKAASAANDPNAWLAAMYSHSPDLK